VLLEIRAVKLQKITEFLALTCVTLLIIGHGIMSNEKSDQPQLFKDTLLNALLSDERFRKLCEEEPYRSWNVQATVNCLGGKPKKVEITKISRKEN